MIRHVVMASLLPGVPDEDVEELLTRWRRLPEEIPEVLRLVAGRNLGLRDGRYALAAVSDFDDELAWRRFMEHPRHLAVRDEISARVIDPSTLATVQFEF